MTPVSEGAILAGKFRVEKLLGLGGMGAVVAARHLQLDERVAIKFLLPGAMSKPEAVARFAREARAATKIKSEHGVRIIDVGSFESGEPYMVMEYLDGKDLGALVEETGPLSPEQAAEYLLQACEALAEAHAHRIIHRDLKPSNLFLTQRMDGSALIKVLDFGISKLPGTGSPGSDLGLTKTSAVMGSPLYMSPEQMSSARDVDMRTDIWSLGVVLYELLAGKPPFEAEAMPQLCTMVMHQEHEPLRARRPALPPAVDEILSRCLCKNRAERYPDVAELAVALAELAPESARHSAERISRVIQGAGLSATALVHAPHSERMPAAREEAAAAATIAATGTNEPASRGRPVLPFVLVGGALALTGAVVLVVVSLRASSKDDQPAMSAAVQPAPLSAEAMRSSDPVPMGSPSSVFVEPTMPAAPTPSATNAQRVVKATKRASSGKAASIATVRPPASKTAAGPTPSVPKPAVTIGGRL